MPQTIKIVDDVANQVTETTLPGSVVLFVGTSIKQPIGKDLVIGTPTQLSNVFGRYPADPASLVNGNLSDVQKKKTIDQLNRNIPYNADMLKSMFIKGNEPVLVAVRVGEYGFSSAVFNENQLINGATDPYNRPTKPGTPIPAITFEALEGGDEYNYFAVKLDSNTAGVATKLTAKYELPVAVGYSSLAPIEDARIQTPYELDIEGLSVDEIVSRFNSPANPFSSYIQAFVKYVEIEKNGITYNRGDKYITIANNQEGAFRLKNVKSFVLESELMDAEFVQGQQSFVLPMSVKKDPDAIVKTMREPKLTVKADYQTTGEFRSQSFKEGNKITPPASMPSVVTVYGFNFIPDYNMFWDKDLTTLKLNKVYIDGNESLAIPASKIMTDASGSKFQIYLSESVIDGIPKPLVNEFEVDGTTPKENSVEVKLLDPTAGETAFTDKQYNSFAVAYVNRKGEYVISEKEIFPTIDGKVLSVKFNYDAANKFKVSEDLTKIFLVGYTQVGVSEVPVVLHSTTMNFGGTTGDEPQWVPSEQTFKVDGTSTTGETLGTNNNTALAKESVTMIFEFVPKMFEVQETSKLNGTWNTYWANGNRIIYGDIIPENFTLDCKFAYQHTLREGTDYLVLSAGRNPGDETDTISILLKPESTEQFASIEAGTFTLKYEVTPSLPAKTSSYVFLKGGVEENYLSDEKYLELCMDKIKYYAPKYKPTHIYVCGLATDFAKEGNDPVTGSYKSYPIGAIAQAGELVDKLNETFACSWHMESKRNYIINTIDKNINKTVKDFIDEHTSATDNEFNAIVLRGAYNTPNLRVASGLLHLDKTTTVSGRNIPYKIPIMASLVSLRNSLLQDFNFERTSLNFPALPATISSLVEGEEMYTALQFYGFEMYSNVYTARGRNVVRAITNPTCVLQDNSIAQGRVYQEVDDAIKKCVQVALRYNELNILGGIGMSKEKIEAHMSQLQIQIKDTFKTSNMLKSITCTLTFADKPSMIRGIGDMTIDASFYPTIRSVNATAKLQIQN